nr:hypothetical protein CFP56_26987 [Quercus suber]
MAKIHHHQTHKPLNLKPTLNTAKPMGWVGKNEELKRELGQWNGLERSANWVGERAGLELGKRAGFVVVGLVQIGDGGREKLRGKMEKKM